MEYVLYDVDKIKDYVFDSFRPKEVKGASELLKTLDYEEYDNKNSKKEKLLLELTETFNIPDDKIIFSKGGSGLLITGNNNGNDICTWLEEKFFDHLHGGGSLTAVSHPFEKDFPTTLSILNFKSRDKKAAKLISHDLNVTIFDKEEKNRCTSCGKRIGVHDEYVGGEEVKYCDICHSKRHSLNKGKEKFEAESLEDICKAPGMQDSKYILAVYGDINEAGNHLSKITDDKELKRFSNGISKVIDRTRSDIETKLENRGFKLLAPIIGGDDLFIFTHPASFELIKDNLFQFESSLPRSGMKMNFSFFLAKYNFPIYHLFKKSQSLLDLTKEAYYTSGQTYYGFLKVLEGQSRPSHGTDIYTREEFISLFTIAEQIHKDRNIHKTALHILLESISDRHSNLEKDMNIRYFRARHREFETYLSEFDSQFHLVHDSKKIKLTYPVLEDLITMRDLLYKPLNEIEEA